MSTTIWKFPLELTERQVIRMPAGAEILKVARQHHRLQLWARVQADMATVSRLIRITGTGHPASRTAAHIDSLVDGEFVWHFFDEGERYD